MEQPIESFNEKIRNKMLVRILLLIGGLLLILGIALFFVTHHFFAEELREKSEYLVMLTASQIDDWMEEKNNFLETISLHADQGFDKKLMSSAMKKYAALTIYIGYADGKFEDASGWQPPVKYDPRERAWYLQAALNKKMIYTKPYLDAATKEVVVTLSLPLYQNDKLFGVIAMDVPIKTITNKINQLKVGEHSQAYLIHPDGTYITHADREHVLKSNIKDSEDAKYFAEYSIQKNKCMVFKQTNYIIFCDIPKSNWDIVFHLPYYEINKPAQHMTLLFIIGIIITLSALSLTIGWLSGKLASPVLKLANGAKELAKGNYDLKMNVQSHDEIGYLTHSFNNMIDNLKDREFIKSTFGRYVSPEVAYDILNNHVNMGGEEKQVTVLFSDIRGFTSLTEDLEPASVVSFLNDYFTLMDKCISDNGGYVNKFMGDGILAVFGAPKTLENSALSAVNSAISMIEVLSEFNKNRFSSIKIGIGIHTGNVLVGNIGSQDRTEYTVIGDTVNLTSRMESLTKVYSLPILISDITAAALEEKFTLKRIDKVRVKGKKTAVEMFSPLLPSALDNDTLDLVNAFNTILSNYYDGDFNAVITQIEQMDIVLPPYMQLIHQRSKDNISTPPENWDGVFTHTKK